jgi:hypothetical protein
VEVLRNSPLILILELLVYWGSQPLWAKTNNGPPVNKSNWQIMVDEQTQLKITDFFKTTDGVIEPKCEKNQQRKQADMPVETFRMDDGAG